MKDKRMQKKELSTQKQTHRGMHRHTYRHTYRQSKVHTYLSSHSHMQKIILTKIEDIYKQKQTYTIILALTWNTYK